MKKFLLLFVAILVVGCGNQDENNDTNSEPNQETNTESNSTEENMSVKFRNIDITTPKEQIVVKGEAAATGDSFFFILKYGEEVVVEETKVKLDTNTSGWGSFELEIDIPKGDKTKQQIPVLTFYVKDKSGKIINPNYIPVDLGE